MWLCWPSSHKRFFHYNLKIKIYKLSIDGKEYILHIFSAYESIGEVAVFFGSTFPANAETLEDSSLLYIPREELISLYKKEPSLAMNMLGVLSKRLREFTNIIEELSLKELHQRLANHLLKLSNEKEKNSICLEYSKGTLAKILGTSGETLSRVLSKMIKQKIIQMDNKNISILKPDILASLAEGTAKL